MWKSVSAEAHLCSKWGVPLCFEADAWEEYFSGRADFLNGSSQEIRLRTECLGILVRLEAIIIENAEFIVNVDVATATICTTRYV